MRILFAFFFIIILTNQSFSNQKCSSIDNLLISSECYIAKRNIELALKALSKFKESSDEEIYDFIDFKKIQILQNSKRFETEIKKFATKYPKSNLLKKVDFMHLEFLSENNLNLKLEQKIKFIEEKYPLKERDRLKIKFYKGLYFYKIEKFKKAFSFIKSVSIRNPSIKTKEVNQLIDIFRNKHSFVLNKKEKIKRLNKLYLKRQYLTFMSEYENNLSLQLLVKKSLIELKSKKEKKGLNTLKGISIGKFTSSGSQAKDLEAIAESKYQIILYELKTSKDNSALAIRLSSILTNYPNFSKNTEAGHLSARLFTLDKKYKEAIKIYNWLIKTKSEGYINKSFYGLGFSEYMLGNYKDAVGYFRLLKESDEIYYRQLGTYWTGKCLIKLNDKNLAMEEFKGLVNKYEMGYYTYLASKKFHKKNSSSVFKEAKKSSKHKDDIMLLKISKNNKKLRKEVENYIRNKINSSNFSTYLSELNQAKEFNLSIKISYSYNADKKHKFPRGYESIVLKSAQKYGVDPNLIFALIREESLYDSNAVSWVGAKGLMQIMDKTAKSLDKELKTKSNLFNPEDNVNLGSYYLMKLLRKFDNNIPNALAAYNGGPNNVILWRERFKGLDDDEFVENIPFKETHGYVKRVLRSYQYYKNNN